MQIVHKMIMRNVNTVLFPILVEVTDQVIRIDILLINKNL